MKILVVYESNEKSTANHYASLFIDELNRYSNNVISEIHLNSILKIYYLLKIFSLINIIHQIHMIGR